MAAMRINARSHVVRSSQLSTWSLLSLVVAVFAMTVLAPEGSAQAANRSTSNTSSHSAAPALRQLSAAICHKVSATSVSKIVGHSVPAPTYSATTEPATKENSYISYVTGTCQYGKDTTAASVIMDVFLVIKITSKPLTAAELKEEVESAETGSTSTHYKITPYSGLGTASYYLTVSGSGFFAQSISSVSGTTFFGASVETKTLPLAKLGLLAKLAGKL
jgi:hypothetical protein